MSTVMSHDDIRKLFVHQSSKPDVFSSPARVPSVPRISRLTSWGNLFGKETCHHFEGRKIAINQDSSKKTSFWKFQFPPSSQKFHAYCSEKLHVENISSCNSSTQYSKYNKNLGKRLHHLKHYCSVLLVSITWINQGFSNLLW